MRKFFVGGALACALLVNVLAAPAAPANFAGTWALDKSKSADLPPQWSNLESLTLTVTQDAQQFTVASEMKRSPDANANAGGGGGMGGGRGRGMGGFPPSATYKLDGTETTAEAMGGTSTMKAEWKDGSKTLELKRVSKFNFQGNDVTATTTEDWSLSADGKTLTIKRSSESPRGSQNSMLVFDKK
jgi:hypothetical protein